MAAYEPLPWLRGVDTLQAIQAGSQYGMEKARLLAQSYANSRPRYIGGGGGGGGVSPGIDALHAAEAAKIEAETKAAQEQQQGAQSAWELHNSLVSRGATEQEAYDQSGLAQFGVKPGDLERMSADKVFEVGDNVVKVDPLTGKNTILYSQPPKIPAEKRYSGPTSVDLFGKPTSNASLTLREWHQMAPNLPDQVRTNAPVSQYAQWGGATNAFSPSAVTMPTSTGSTNGAPQFPAFKIPMSASFGNMEGGSPADYSAPAIERPSGGGGNLSVDQARSYLAKAGGNRAKAEAMARADGYSF